jgi:hypothetical protein
LDHGAETAAGFVQKIETDSGRERFLVFFSLMNRLMPYLPGEEEELDIECSIKGG